MAATQQDRPFGITTPLGEDVLLLKRLTLVEELGRPFEATLDLLSEDASIAFDDLVGQGVTLRITTTRGSTRYVHGVVNRFAQREPLGRTARYEATVVPWLWLLTRTSDCRIFQHKTVPEILRQLFGEHALGDHDDCLGPARYRSWEYCVQYRETDFAFVSRLMEQEGIYYYFAHEQGRHVLVLADGTTDHQAFPDYEEVSFRPASAGSSDPEHVHRWRVEKHVVPGAVALNDFDFRSPKKALRVASQADRAHRHADFERYDYPGEYREFAEGEASARVRLDAHQAQHEVVRAESDLRGISAGYTVRLADYPREDQCRDYLVTATRLVASNDQYASTGEPLRRGPSCSCAFAAIPANTQFRAQALTPTPLVSGPQTATVVGPAGEEIYTDKHGRVKVQFHWDRYGESNERSSCWIRVSQTWAGKKWGAMHIPRIGQEVIVDFLEGDPDRPIITGRVYNGLETPPYTLPEHKTRSTVKSNSSKGGQGFNELRFEDKKGKEQVFLHAQRDKDERVRATSREFVGGKRHLIVKGDQLEKVEGDKFLHVLGQRQEVVDGAVMLRSGNVQHLVDDFFALSVEGGSRSISMVAQDAQIMCGNALTLRCGTSIITLTRDAIYIKGDMVHINPSGWPPMARVTTGTYPSPCQPAGADTGREGGASSPGRSGRRRRRGQVTLGEPEIRTVRGEVTLGEPDIDSGGGEGEQSITLGEAERIDTEEGGDGSVQGIELGEAERIDTEETGEGSGQVDSIELGEAERIDTEETGAGEDSGQVDSIELGEAERIDPDEAAGDDGGGTPPQP